MQYFVNQKPPLRRLILGLGQFTSLGQQEHLQQELQLVRLAQQVLLRELLVVLQELLASLREQLAQRGLPELQELQAQLLAQQALALPLGLDQQQELALQLDLLLVGRLLGLFGHPWESPCLGLLLCFNYTLLKSRRRGRLNRHEYER
jgi:hypothetical protein